MTARLLPSTRVLRPLRSLRFVAVAAGFLLLAPHLAFADVPGRVGRIAFMQGDVQSYSDTEPQWKVAYVNEPITSRNSVFTGDGARAEISVGSTTLAMDAGSQVDIQQLDDTTFNANVVRGRVSMRIRHLDAGDTYDVAVPGANFALLQPGRYRVDSLDASTGLVVFAGQATAQTDQNEVPIRAGTAVRIAADPNDQAAPQLLNASTAPVALDEWVVSREARFQDGLAQRYVSPNMTGYEELDANGQWSSDPDVGPVWYPTTYVRSDWAPYRYGRWAYVAPWGYTWIDDAPWGFAPFHYGRWLQVGNRWGWVPGAYVARPAYAPALVGFYGGSGFNASFAVGAGPAVGWYPLAPWQRYAPHYTQRAAYINEVNNIRIVNPPPRFARGDWNREHGGTVAPQDAFASQRSISRVAMAAPPGLSGRATPLSPNALPRASEVPGAIRRGPEGVGIPHPEFRAPRDFAQREPGRFERPADGGRRPQEAVAGPTPVQPQPQPERAGLPQNYRRLPDAPRPGVATEAPRAPMATPAPVDRAAERANLQQRLPTQPGMRPAPQAADIDAERSRFAPQRAEQGAAIEQRAPERAFDRPNRDFRAPPPPVPQPVAPSAPSAVPRQNVERPQGFERPQSVERPQGFERPQNAERPQSFERPQNIQRPQAIERPQAVERPQAIERPQRVEQRAAPAAPAPPVAPAPPRPAPPAAAPRVEPPRLAPSER